MCNFAVAFRKECKNILLNRLSIATRETSKHILLGLPQDRYNPEAGELKDPTISAEEIDAHYSNNEPITKLSEEYNNAIAEIQAKDSSIQVPEDGDADIDGL